MSDHVEYVKYVSLFLLIYGNKTKLAEITDSAGHPRGIFEFLTHYKA